MGRPATDLPARAHDRSGVGVTGRCRFLGHLPTRDQHRDHHRHLPDGVPDPELAEPRRGGDAGQARRADPRARQRTRPVHRHRAPGRIPRSRKSARRSSARRRAEAGTPTTAEDSVERLLDRYERCYSGADSGLPADAILSSSLPKTAVNLRPRHFRAHLEVDLAASRALPAAAPRPSPA